MALDLTLTALPATARFALDKACAQPEYAAYLDKLVAPDEMRKHLEVEAYSGEPSQALRLELLTDAESLQPLRLPAPTKFYGLSRSYATIDYLLQEWLKAHNQPRPAGYHIFYSGTRLNTNGDRGYFGYLLPAQVAAIHSILSQIKFADLLGRYTYERMNEEGVYKLTGPDNFRYMKEEYAMLRGFFWAAHTAGSFVLIDLW